MKKRVTALLIATLLALSLLSCSNANGEADTTAVTTEEAAKDNKLPDFTVYNVEGEKVTLYSKLGKPMVINFWATWCPPCKSEMPAFNELYKEYGDEIEFMMINLTDGSRDTVDGVKSFIAQNGYTFPVYYDSDMNAATLYGVSSIPMTVFVSSNGELIDYKIGAISEDVLKGYLERMRGF